MIEGQSDPLLGKRLADRFEIVERIGEGGTGVVYRARQLSVDRDVAVKVLGAHVSTYPQWVRRFHAEAKAASRLDHPHTVRLIDFGQTPDGLLFIAMELLKGHSLGAEIKSTGRMPANRVLRILMQICQSLAHAHGSGIIHRDLKPDNVYLVELQVPGDYVKVLDFSVGKQEGDGGPGAEGVTGAGMVFGTPQYMAPEQARGHMLDARSDIYSLGIVAYELLSGRPPFDGKIPSEVALMQVRDPPPPLAGVPPRLERMVLRALEKDPARRQQTMLELEAECQACLAELIGPQAPAPVVQARTVMAEAPVVAGQRTVMAATAPTVGVLPPPPAPGGGGHDAKTLLAAAAPKLPTVARSEGTRLLPDSEGLVAYDASHLVRAAPPPGALFWMAWIVLGIGAGLAVHFYMLQRAPL